MKKVVVAIIVLFLAISLAQSVKASAQRTSYVNALDIFSPVGCTCCREQWIHVECKYPCVIRMRDYYGQLLWSSDWDNQDLKLRISWKKGIYFAADYWCGSDVSTIEARLKGTCYQLVTITYEE